MAALETMILTLDTEFWEEKAMMEIAAARQSTAALDAGVTSESCRVAAEVGREVSALVDEGAVRVRPWGLHPRCCCMGICMLVTVRGWVVPD